VTAATSLRRACGGGDRALKSLMTSKGVFGSPPLAKQRISLTCLLSPAPARHSAAGRAGSTNARNGPETPDFCARSLRSPYPDFVALAPEELKVSKLIPEYSRFAEIFGGDFVRYNCRRATHYCDASEGRATRAVLVLHRAL
jgi:hypothetical protein